MAIFNYSVTKTPLRVLIICQSDQKSTFPSGTNSNQDIKLHFCSQNIPGSLPGTMYWITIICDFRYYLEKQNKNNNHPTPEIQALDI